MSETSIIKKFWRKNSPIFLWQISGNFPSNPFFKPTDPWIGNKVRGQDLFLKHPSSFSEEYWHNFDWLRDLKESKNNNYRKRARELYINWFSKNYRWNEKSWSPSILSNRLINILLCYSSFAETGDDEFQDNLMDFFAKQSRCLEIDCERIKNIQEKFICLCGLVAGRIGLTQIEDEIKIILEQVIQNSSLLINPDGMHISRQPQKHFQVLKKLIEVRNISSNFIISYREKLNLIINKMIISGKIIRHSNGMIADFNNGCNYESFLIEQIFNKVNSSSVYNKFSNDGYINIKTKNSNLIFDCGNPVINWNNFHSGTLAFEFCYLKQMIIINCGSNINNKKWLHYLKGTSAHSTINIDNFNSTSILKNKNKVANIREKSSGKTEGGFFVEASHDGYSKSHGIIHKRKLEINTNGDSLKGIDELIYIDGFSKIPLEANVSFHLSPDIKVSKVLGGDVLLRLPNKEGWFFRTNLNMVYIEDSVKVENSTLKKTKQIIVTIPLLDLKNRGSKTFEWKLFKN